MIGSSAPIQKLVGAGKPFVTGALLAARQIHLGSPCN